MTRFPTFLTLTVLSGASVSFAHDLPAKFLTPPDAVRPGVYWTIQDGNQNRKEMVADMDALHAVGYGSILFMEVDLGFAMGPVTFMSTQWVDNIANGFFLDPGNNAQNSVFDLDWANVSSKLNSLKSKSEALCLRGMLYANGVGSASPGLAVPDAYPGMVW